MSDILSLFPLDKPRPSQVSVINAIEKAYADGYKNVLLEAPVGSGKSAIAITIAKHFGDAHILTPMKSLQDQYYEDFKEEDIVLMKGRNSYPCLNDSPEKYSRVINQIKSGVSVPVGETSCAEGPCTISSRYKTSCAEELGLCPYHVAIETAQASDLVIHNLHSFIFQAYFADRFQEREIMIIDECHRVEDIVRGFASKVVTIPKYLMDSDLPENQASFLLSEWSTWMYGFVPLYSDNKDSFGVSNRDRFVTTLEGLDSLSDKIGRDFVLSVTLDPITRKTRFEFIPERVSELTNKLLLDFGKRTLLMSGTIYNKAVFCKNLGLREEDTCFIRIGSSFPLNNRPIYLKDKYLVDTSHKQWDKNYTKMISNIKEIMTVFGDVKGLIHTPSYRASQQIALSLADTGRVFSHEPENFSAKLEEFYLSTEPKVLLSPICQQGVDFKYDRARFQIVLRVPYANTSDPFTAKKVSKDFPWYNYQALVTFGQQIGRVNRAEDDFGVTVLLDERFKTFIQRNRNVLPKWIIEAITS